MMLWMLWPRYPSCCLIPLWINDFVLYHLWEFAPCLPAVRAELGLSESLLSLSTRHSLTSPGVIKGVKVSGILYLHLTTGDTYLETARMKISLFIYKAVLLLLARITRGMVGTLTIFSPAVTPSHLFLAYSSRRFSSSINASKVLHIGILGYDLNGLLAAQLYLVLDDQCSHGHTDRLVVEALVVHPLYLVPRHRFGQFVPPVGPVKRLLQRGRE